MNTWKMPNIIIHCGNADEDHTEIPLHFETASNNPDNPKCWEEVEQPSHSTGGSAIWYSSSGKWFGNFL